MLKSLLREHLALLLSMLAALTVVIKIWAVSHGDIRTMSALIASGGVATTILAALVVGLPAIGVAIALVAGNSLFEGIREGDDLKGPIVGLAVGLLLAALLAPVWILAVGVTLSASILAVSLLVVGGRRGWERWVPQTRVPFLLRRSSQPRRSTPQAEIVFLALVGWFAIAVSPTPWFPSEVLETRDDVAVVGYVLEDGESTVVMRHEDRAIIRLNTDLVTTRHFCRPSGREDRSLAALMIWGRGELYSSCNDLK